MTTTTITKRAAGDRGPTDLGWLQSRHTFSFGEYHDPEHMGFRSLRVINDDNVAPGMGFGTHPHSSMEIFSYVINGELAHKDSMGNGSTIKAGQLQYMSAGSGVEHSEFNPSKDQPVHFLQIWIQPKKKGGEPRYQEADPGANRQPDSLLLLASSDGHDNSIAMRQDGDLYFGNLGDSKEISVPENNSYPYGWLHLISGELTLADQTFGPGDAASIEGAVPTIKATADAEFLLFRLS